MKFTVNQSEMFDVLGRITKVLERTQTRDVLSHAQLVVSESGELQISCTDLTMTMVAKLQLERTEEPGSASIPGLRLFEIFRAIGSNADVTFETVENMIEISFERSKYQLNVMSGSGGEAGIEGFLSKPPEDAVVVELPANQLRRQLLYTTPVMGAKESRAYMVATCFELAPTHFRTIATEASVLAMATRTAEIPEVADSEEGVRSFIVPRKTVEQIENMLGGAKGAEKVSLTFGSNHVSAQIGVFSLTSNLLNTTYPVYQNVFPEELDWSATCSRTRLLSSVVQVDVVAADSSHRMVWDMADDVLNMQSASTRNDRANVDVELENLTGPRQMSMNAQKILLLLNTLDTDKVIFSSTTKEAHANIQIHGENEQDDKSDGETSDLDVVYLVATMSDR